MRPLGNPGELERRRLEAVKLLRSGHQPVAVARQLGVDRRSVRRWHAAYRKNGKKGLKAVPNPGPTPKLNQTSRKGLAKALLKGAKSSGFPTDLWTCPRVVKLLHDRFGVDYHVDHVGRLLHALGFSPQKPQRRAIERDEAEIRRWVREEWPRIKKKRGG